MRAIGAKIVRHLKRAATGPVRAGKLFMKHIDRTMTRAGQEGVSDATGIRRIAMSEVGRAARRNPKTFQTATRYGHASTAAMAGGAAYYLGKRKGRKEGKK